MHIILNCICHLKKIFQYTQVAHSWEKTLVACLKAALIWSVCLLACVFVCLLQNHKSGHAPVCVVKLSNDKEEKGFLSVVLLFCTLGRFTDGCCLKNIQYVLNHKSRNSFWVWHVFSLYCVFAEMSSADGIHCNHIEEISCTNQYKGIKVHSGGNEYVCYVRSVGSLVHRNIRHCIRRCCVLAK